MFSRGLVIAALAVVGVVAAYLVYRDVITRVCCAPAPFVVPPRPVRVRPSDFSLELTGRTGTVAPRYFYRYALRVQPTSGARYTVWPGYDDAGPSWTKEFRIGRATLDSLWAEFEKGGLSRMPAAEDIDLRDRPVGGGSARLVVLAHGDTTVLDTDRRDSWAERVTRFITRVESLTPDSVRMEMRQRQIAWGAAQFGREPR